MQETSQEKHVWCSSTSRLDEYTSWNTLRSIILSMRVVSFKWPIKHQETTIQSTGKCDRGGSSQGFSASKLRCSIVRTASYSACTCSARVRGIYVSECDMS